MNISPGSSRFLAAAPVTSAPASAADLIYRAHGFQVSGAQPFDYPHPLKDGLQTHLIVMSKPL